MWAIGLVTILASIVIAYWSLRDSSPVPVSAQHPTRAALAVAPIWPFTTGCGAFSSVAMPVGGGRITDFHAVTDLRAPMVAAGAGSWTRGVLYLDLSLTTSTPVEIADIQPHILRRDLGAPAWIYIPSAGCGPFSPDRVFTFNLDVPRWTDDGAQATAAGPPARNVPKAPLGPRFVLSGHAHTRVRVDALSCRGNYEWNVSVKYIPQGSSHENSITVGPFESYGLGNNTVEYNAAQDATGAIKVMQKHLLTGPDPQAKYMCGAAAG